MATGADFLRAAIAYVQLKACDGFIVYIGPLPTDLEPSQEAIYERAARAIDRRLAPAERVLQQLSRELRETGVVFQHPQRGLGIRLERTLTNRQEYLLEDFKKELKKVCTYIKF